MTPNSYNFLDQFAGAIAANNRAVVSISGNTSFSHNSANDSGGENGEKNIGLGQDS